MRKLFIFVAGLAWLSLSGTSCGKKDWKCLCTVQYTTNMNTSDSYQTEEYLLNQPKSHAERICTQIGDDEVARLQQSDYVTSASANCKLREIK